MAEGTAEHLHAGEVIAGKYMLVRPLAKGGMGAVWLATHQELETELAIKFMAPDLVASSHLRARFKREAKAAAQLKSRHVVRVLDHGVDDGVPYIAMELLEGEDLKTRLRRERRLRLSDTLEILEQAGKALSRAHAQGIVHRDLKPANIFIANIDGEEVVKVLDFGVAKLTTAADDGESTRTGVVVGSPNYMSPEQARTTGDVDHRSDLWSMGVILFRCISGRPPFRGQTMADVIVKICAEPIPKPSDYAPELAPAVDAFFERALSRDVANRFQSLDEMIRSFAEIVDGQAQAPPVPAARPVHPSTIGPSSFGSKPLFDDDATTVARDVGTLTGQGAVTAPSPVPPQSRVPPVLLWVAGALAAIVALGAWQLARTGAETNASREGAVSSSSPASATSSSPAAAVEPSVSATPSTRPSASALASGVATPSATASASAAASTPKPSPRVRTQPKATPRPAPTPGAPQWGF